MSNWYKTVYLNSKHWKKTRDAKLINSDFKCEYCAKTYNLEVHHLHYNSLWCEDLDSDLACLCRSCHQNIHDDDDFCEDFISLKGEKYNAENETDFYDWS